MSRTTVAVGTLSAEQVQEVLAVAQEAPTLHRSRPWRFHCTETTIEMLLDLPPDPWGNDHDHREAWVACGAALLNLRLAIRSCGADPVVHLMPKLDRPLLVASLEIDGRRPTTSERAGLSLAVGSVRTHVRHFEAGPIPGALLVELRYAARREQAWIALLPSSALPALLQFVDESVELELRDRSAQVAVIGTLQDDSASRLRAGQAMQRVLLTAARAELGARFLSMAPDLQAGRARLRQSIGGGLWPQVLLQIGRIAA
ncbi:hypothetical protein [Nakamurella sp. PAMC28650]|uniref:hypothetical protein n=1 Tax=Nakamurella sp. PAMC28650 TaxID=2762325 RepID=UPI00164EC77F|nr:hypothetical protein [Nakamurella sp. PAMC28650]QNK80247.1 hypothetical protein H7F38_18890 [Nakamurella sp. PAMC28650]